VYMAIGAIYAPPFHSKAYFNAPIGGLFWAPTDNERWHVTKQGLIARSVGYPADVELKLMSRFTEMKGLIGDNEKRIKELWNSQGSSTKSRTQ